MQSSRSRRSDPSHSRFRYAGSPFGVHCPGPCRSKPAFVAMTRSSGYGWSASAISRSETSGPYELAVSMKFTPSSTARCSTRRHSSGSSGSPQMPRPVRRIAAKPSRFTVSSPPMSKVPDAATIAKPYACHHERHVSTDRFTASGFPAVDDAGDADRYVHYLDAQAATPFWRAAKRASIEALGLQHGSTALDVGCGTGEEV